jgi:hypothetical protein
MTDYRAAATNNFNKLQELYTTDLPSSFWKMGNTFDTMIDYLDIIDSSGANALANWVVAQFYCGVGQVAGPGKLGGFASAWFDDFGWWSIATQRALQKSFFDEAHQERFTEIRDECWPRFKENAPFVWARHKPGTFDDYAPAVPNGVWNAYWPGTPDKYKGPQGDPSEPDALAGIQNTVTNALYVMAAQRIDGWTDPAKNALSFIRTWFVDNKTPLWSTIDANAGLVRERVGHFANGNAAPGFQTDWYWTGDQGLMLGNLSDASRAGVVPPSIAGHAIVAGTAQKLVEANKVLRNYSKTGIVPHDDTGDYVTGSGVFWRNFLHVWRTNPNNRPALPEAVLRASADAAKASNDYTFDAASNQLSVLVAAAALLK